MKVQPEDIATIVAAYGAGRSTDQIGADFGVSGDTIGRLLRGQGVALRVPVRSKAADAEEIVRLYRDGWTLTDLGHIFHCHRNTIYGRLAEAGVKPPRPPPPKR